MTARLLLRLLTMQLPVPHRVLCAVGIVCLTIALAAAWMELQA